MLGSLFLKILLKISACFIAVCFNKGNNIGYWFIELLFIILYISFNKCKQFPAKAFQD